MNRENFKSKFVTHQITPGSFEVGHNIKTLDNLANLLAAIDKITRKPILETKKKFCQLLKNFSEQNKELAHTGNGNLILIRCSREKCIYNMSNAFKMLLF